MLMNGNGRERTKENKGQEQDKTTRKTTGDSETRSGHLNREEKSTDESFARRSRPPADRSTPSAHPAFTDVAEGEVHAPRAEAPGSHPRLDVGAGRVGGGA